MSALLLAELVDRVCTEFRDFVKVDSVHCWIDSMVALHWISGSEKSCNGFVRRRVESIRGLVPLESWLHVDSKLNPADALSRGAFMSQLSGNNLWFHGPNFLSSHSDYTKFSLSSMLNITAMLLSTTHEEGEEVIEEEEEASKSDVALPNIIAIDHFNNFEKLIRVVAYVNRFITNLKKKLSNKELLLSEEISVNEINYAERMMIIDCQKDINKQTNYNN